MTCSGGEGSHSAAGRVGAAHCGVIGQIAVGACEHNEIALLAPLFECRDGVEAAGALRRHVGPLEPLSTARGVNDPGGSLNRIASR